MTDKLSVYNLALGHLGQRKLSALSEAIEHRRTLDDFWDHTVAVALAAGLWNFIVRAIQEDASSTVTPAFGWKYAFEVPNDWIRTLMVSTVETFNPPLLDYTEETGFWYANFTPIFVRYQSNDPLYGMNLGAWPANFTDYVAFQLAEYAAKKITGSTELLDGASGISRRCKNARTKAKATDAMNQPPGQPPTGTWARSRRGFLRGVPAPGGSGSSSFDD